MHLVHGERNVRAWVALPDTIRKDNPTTMIIKVVRQPILLMHSTADSVNYYTDALKIYAGTRQRRQDVEFVSFGDFSHNYIYQKVHFDYWAPIVRFILGRSVQR